MDVAPDDRWRNALDKAMDREAIRIDGLACASRRVMVDADSGWVCLMVMSGRENAVKNLLDDADIEAFFPSEKIVVVRRGRKIEVPEHPYFPGYVFVRCALIAPALAALLGVRHVLDVIGGAERPIRLRDESINLYKALITAGVVKKLKANKGILMGDRVRIDVGPYASFYGDVLEVVHFDKVEKQSLAVVLVHVFGREAEIKIPLAYLKKL